VIDELVGSLDVPGRVWGTVAATVLYWQNLGDRRQRVAKRRKPLNDRPLQLIARQRINLAAIGVF
jgi:hypothetical protein